MIINIALLLIYLLLGAWLFVSAVSYLGGIRNIQAYQNPVIMITSAALVIIFWPVFFIQAIIHHRRK